MSCIKNTTALANTPIREHALAIIEAGLAAIDTPTVLRRCLLVEDNVLTVDGRQYNLDDYEHIYIIGFGKVSCTAAQTLEEIFTNHVRAGAVVGVQEQVCAVVDTYAGTHPLPSSLNYTATKHIEEIAHRATERDLVFVIVSGGGSALLCSSMGECEQGKQLFGAFLPSGGTIAELNTVRKHISHLKGGGLAAVLHPATVVGLIFSDVPGGDLAAVASGPTYFDASTEADAQAVIERYDLGEYTLTETPKDDSLFARVHNVAVVSNHDALVAMRATASDLGYQAEILSETHYATPEETATLLANHTTPGTARLLGGETRLSVPTHCTGTGGRNDCLALSVLATLHSGQLFASVASDGHDNTKAAGALVDAQTVQKMQRAKLNPATYLECYNSYPFFAALDEHIITGPLESNVSDLLLLLNEQTPPPPITVPITAVRARVVTDSRTQPTIEVTVVAGEHQGSFSVPSGASTGEREVVALPAQDAAQQVNAVIAPALLGMSVGDQASLDARLHELDGTENFATLGGNAALGVSVAACKAAAASLGREPWEYIRSLFAEPPQAETPYLFVNLINGGAHAKQGSSIQEHQIIPETTNPHEAFRVACAVQRTLHDVLKDAYGATAITLGDEGGFVIPSQTITEPFTHLAAAVTQTEANCAVSLGTDVAASSFATADGYVLAGERMTGSELCARLSELCATVPALRYVEDPASETDTKSFAAFRAANPNCMVIGDDLTTTNARSLQAAVTERAITGIIIKPNQIGTLTDTLETMRIAYQHNIACIVSHRSGETMDSFIADLAYGTRCFGLKAGAPTARERLRKYQRLLDITSRSHD